MPQDYERKKFRMQTDPAYKAKVMQQQSQSRRVKKARMRQGMTAPCSMPDGRSCWRTDEHQHRGSQQQQG